MYIYICIYIYNMYMYMRTSAVHLMRIAQIEIPDPISLLFRYCYNIAIRIYT